MKGKKNSKAEQFAITQEDKQNDPFIRAVAKKIRNFNKKILDIETLEKRGDLKPEQHEKISSKQSIVDDRKRYEQIAKFYKTILAQAANDKEAKQISPLFGKLANSLILAHYLSSGADLKELQLSGAERKLFNSLASVGKQEAALKDLGAQLGGYFVQYFDNDKLVVKVEEIFSNEKVGGMKVNLYKKPEQPHSHKQEQKHFPTDVKQTPKKPTKDQFKETPTKQLKVEGSPAQKPLLTNVQQPKSSKNEARQDEKDLQEHKPTTALISQLKKEEKLSENVHPQEQALGQTVQAVQATGIVQQKQGEQSKDRPKKPYQDRPFKPRGQGRSRQDGYKPKYSEKVGDREEEEREGEDEEDQDFKRKFNNKEMRDLQNEGFTIVQKKQKPKDPKESESYYRKQHGYKDRRPHDHHN